MPDTESMMLEIVRLMVQFEKWYLAGGAEGGRRPAHMDAVLDRVLELCAAVLAVDPAHAQAHYEMSFPHMFRKDYAGAARLLSATLELEPRHREAAHSLGQAHYESGNLVAAVSAFTQGIAAHPDYVEMHAELGRCKALLDDSAGAVVAFHAALALDPNLALVRGMLGGALHELGDVESADAEWRAAIALSPRDPYIYYSLGRALRKRGDFQGECDANCTAIEIDPDSYEATNNLGLVVCNKHGDYESASTLWRSCLFINPERPQAHSCWQWLVDHESGPRYKPPKATTRAANLVAVRATIKRVRKMSFKVEPDEPCPCTDFYAKAKKYKACCGRRTKFVLEDVVEILGILSRPELNGSFGVVTHDQDLETGRFGVQCILDQTQRRLKPDNLRLHPKKRPTTN